MGAVATSARGSVALLFLALVASGCLRDPRAERRVQAAIRREVKQGVPLLGRPTVDADDLQPLVRRFYRRRGFHPAWPVGLGPTRDARALVPVLEGAGPAGRVPSE